MSDREKYLAQPRLKPDDGSIPLPNGHTLYWQMNEVGGRNYWSDEIGGMVKVWDTALVDDSTLLAAITQERALTKAEYERKK